MSGFTGFEPAPDTINVTAWTTRIKPPLSPQSPLKFNDLKSRVYNGVTVYWAVDVNGDLIKTLQYVWVPWLKDILEEGGFFMLLSDVLARTGLNYQDKTPALAAMQNIMTTFAITDYSTTTPATISTWDDGGIQRTHNPSAVKGPKTNYANVTEQWNATLLLIKKANPKPFNVLARFWDPPGGPYNIVLLSLDDAVTQNLTTASTKVADTFKDTNGQPKFVIHIAGTNQNHDSLTHLGLVKVGHNFFNAYDTYMEPQGYKDMFVATYTSPLTGTASDPWPIRPWPSQFEASAADSTLIAIEQGDGPYNRSPNREDLSQVEVTAKVVQDRTGDGKDRGLTQRAVMGQQSATTFANLFWPNLQPARRLLPSWASEWLHRTAWSMGGSQTVVNLCFGTSECNTDMIRAENAIKTFVTKTKNVCSLVTQPYDGAMSHEARWLAWALSAQDQVTVGQAPMFVHSMHAGESPYSWAVAFLQYGVIALNVQTNEYFNFAIMFDTFNRYVPLLLEAQIDEELMNEQFANVQAPVPSTNLLMAIQVPQQGAPVPAKPGSMLPLQTHISLFGLTDIQVDISEWQGPLPAGVQPPPGGAPAVFQQATLTQALSIPLLFPELAGTLLDSISLENVAVSYQNCYFDPESCLGWGMSGDIVIGKEAGRIHDLIHWLTDLSEFKIQMNVQFGQVDTSDWTTMLKPQSFSITGTSKTDPIALADSLQLVTLGVRLHAIRTHTSASKSASLSFAWDLFGEMSMIFPQATSPLLFDYTLSNMGDVYMISAQLKGSIWQNAMGIQNLDLDRLSVQAVFSTKSKSKSLGITLSATLFLSMSSIEITGVYNEGGDISLTGVWNDFEIEDLDEIYTKLYATDIEHSSMTITVEQATLSISTQSGLEMTLKNACIHGKYTIQTASVQLSKLGVDIQGSASGNVSIGDVDVTSVDIAVHVPISKTEEPSFLLSGSCTCTTLPGKPSFTVSVDVYYLENELQYTLYGEESGSQTVTLDALLDNYCPSILESVGLEKVAILYSTQDSGRVGSQVVVPFPIVKGLQVYAVLDSVSEIEGTLRGTAPGLVLFARLPSLAVGILLPTSEEIDFGHDIKSGPISLTVTPSELTLAASVLCKASSQDKGVDFDLQLNLGPVGADATISATMDWIGPMGLNAVTLQKVVLSVGIIYATFLEAGPSTLGVLADFQLDQAQDEVALVFGEDPKDKLLKISINDIDINDLLSFATSFAGFSFPQLLPSKAVMCNKFDLYACPDGATLGSKQYPAGFSADLVLTIFDKQASASLQIDSSGLKCQASLPNFKLGPLQVQGFQDPTPTVKIGWTSSEHAVHIDGQISLLDSSCGLHIDIEPPSTFVGHLHLMIFGIWDLDVEAGIVGDVKKWQTPCDGETIFLSAAFGADAIQFVQDQVKDQLEKGRNETQQYKQYTPKNVPDVPASATVMAIASTTWQTKQQSILAEFEAFQVTMKSLSARLKVASDKYTTALSKATYNLAAKQREQANAQRWLKYVQENQAIDIKLASSHLEVQQEKLDTKLARLPQQIQLQSQNISDIEGMLKAIPDLPYNRTAKHRMEVANLQARNLDLSLKTIAIDHRSKGIEHAVKKAKHAVTKAQDALQLAKKGKSRGLDIRALDLDSANHKVSDAQDRLKAVQSGPEYKAYVQAQSDIAQHLTTLPPYLTPEGFITDTTSIVEYKNVLVARQSFLTTVDDYSGLQSIISTVEFLISGFLHVLDAIGQALEKFASDFISISGIGISASLTETDSEDRINFDAIISGKFCLIPFSHTVDFQTEDHHGMIHSLVASLMNNEWQQVLKKLEDYPGNVIQVTGGGFNGPAPGCRIL